MSKKDQLLDYNRIRFLHLLFRSYLRFKEIFQEYEKDRALPRWRDVESLCQHEFSELRDLAHRIFRRSIPSDEETRLHDFELLCDLVIGVCYHEILQLQENLYLSKLYRPRYKDLRSQMDASDIEEYFQIGENLIEEAEARIPENLKSIRQLLEEALTLMKRILAAYANNRIVLRFLTRHLDLLEKVYGRDSREDLFRRMFPGGMAEAMWRTAGDLAKSAHFSQALDCVSKLALLVQNGNAPEGFSRSDVAKTLNRIHKEGKAIRDNELVSRSQNLLRQFQ